MATISKGEFRKSNKVIVFYTLRFYDEPGPLVLDMKATIKIK